MNKIIVVLVLAIVGCEALPKHPREAQNDEIISIVNQISKEIADIKEKLADLEADLMILESSPKTCEPYMGD